MVFLAAVALSIGFLSIRPLIKPPVPDLCAKYDSTLFLGATRATDEHPENSDKMLHVTCCNDFSIKGQEAATQLR